MQRRALILGLLSTVAAGCVAPRVPTGFEPAPSRSRARQRLGELAAEYERLCHEHGLTFHRRLSGEADASGSELAELRRAEREVFEEAERLLEYHPDILVSPREAELWKRGALALRVLGDAESSRLADELEALQSDFPFELEGQRVTRADLAELGKSRQREERRQTRRAMHQLHVAAKPLAVQLMLRRQQLALEQGERSYWELMLRLRGVDRRRLERAMFRLMRETRRSSHRLLRHLRRLNHREPLAPWDVQWTLERSTRVPDHRFVAAQAEGFCKQLLSRLGIDLSAVKLQVRDNLAFGGQSIAVRIPSDVRVTLRRRAGARFYATMLHELGHAFAATQVTTERAVYKGYEWVPGLFEPGFDEGFAEVFSLLLDEPEVHEQLGLRRIERVLLVRYRRWSHLLGLRRLAARIQFERAAYRRPERDLDRLSLDYERRVQRLAVKDDTEPIWATSSLLPAYPVYIQSYLLAMMMSAQVMSAWKQQLGARWFSSEAAPWLARLVEEGSRWTLDEKLVLRTGAPLSSRQLGRRLRAS